MPSHSLLKFMRLLRIVMGAIAAIAGAAIVEAGEKRLD
jgi:hypothetical protein